MASKYPNELASAVRVGQMVSLEGFFGQDNGEEEKSKPMQIFDKFSRYVLTVSKASNSGKLVSTGNVPIEMADIVWLNSKAAYKEFTASKKPSEDVPQSPAFTKRFFSGTLKGKTPAEVLTQPDGKELLNKQYKWLKDNLPKYPKNKELMDAIVDAAKLDPETLKGISPSSSVAFPIIDIGVRPLIRKKREDGACACYEVHVDFDSGKKYPVTVCVKNYYAPVQAKEGGQFNVVLSKKDKATEKDLSMVLSMEEWMQFAGAMKHSYDAFYSSCFMSAHEIANKITMDAIRAAKEAS